MNTVKMTDKNPGQEHYETPIIVHRGELKQFAGSPLGGGDNGESDNVLGLPG